MFHLFEPSVETTVNFNDLICSIIVSDFPLMSIFGDDDDDGESIVCVCIIYIHI